VRDALFVDDAVLSELRRGGLNGSPRRLLARLARAVKVDAEAAKR
jgi:hypothetical protein